MPLNQSGFKDAFEALCSSPGATVADCAGLWAEAFVTYFAAVTPPSATVSAAGVALQGQLAAAFATPNAIPAMDLACTAFALAVGSGMAPAFVAVPPPAPFGWALVLAPPYATSHAEAAQRVATALDTWARTGTATPSVGGSPVPWS
jgi:hypothetical protein